MEDREEEEEEEERSACGPREDTCDTGEGGETPPDRTRG